jgi:hypothetical protein
LFLLAAAPWRRMIDKQERSTRHSPRGLRKRAVVKKGKPQVQANAKTIQLKSVFYEKANNYANKNEGKGGVLGIKAGRGKYFLWIFSIFYYIIPL